MRRALFACLFVLNVSRVAAGLHAAVSLCGPAGCTGAATTLSRLLLFVAVRAPVLVFRRRYLGEGYGPVQGQRGFPVTAQFLSGCLECIQQC